MLTPTQRDALEAMIDADDLSSVLSEIADLCMVKAQHIHENWQDETTAKAWTRAADTINTASTALTVTTVSKLDFRSAKARSKRH